MNTQTYRVKPNTLLINDEEAQEVGNALERIRRRKRFLFPKYVVDEARNPNSVLHRFFNWNDAEAADEFRKTQARRLINSITVRVEEDPGDERTISAFVRVSHDEGYKPGRLVRRDPQSRDVMVSRLTKKIERLCEQLSEYPEFDALVRTINRTLKKIDRAA